ncbi:MAG: hypothetical protein GX594_18240 [Pirellulaceae bacterium]|nr:hypothetical protein [Pirellulaceae bacterium]
MRWEFGNPSQEQTTPFAPAADSEQTPAVAAAEAPEAADSPPPPDEAFNPQPIVLDLSSPSNASAPFVGGWAFSYIVASVFVCLLLLGFWAYKLPSDRGSSIASNENSRGLTAHGASPHARPAPVFVGRVTGIAGAKWSDDPDYIAPLGVGVALGRTYKLKSGLMEITYDSGAKVILEGPCSYEVDSTAGGYLSLGKLVAKVECGERRVESDNSWRLTASGNNTVMAQPPEAVSLRLLSKSPNRRIHSPLFTVRTPTAVVTDLGTEFGVEVAINGDTTSHVFEGTVVIQAGIRGFGDSVIGNSEIGDSGIGDSDKRPATAVAGDQSDQTVTLVAGQSVCVDRVDVTHQEPAAGAMVRFTHPAARPQFARRLREPPKLLDLLDIVAGGDGRGKRRERGIDPSTGMEDPVFLFDQRSGDCQYHLVTRNRLIDGVFIPDSRIDAVQINSGGAVFDGFRQTTGTTIGGIWPRAAEVSPSNQRKERWYWAYAIDCGEQFMPEMRGLLCMHANSGITFDLAAMRQLHEGSRLVRFRAIAGMADAARVMPDKNPNGIADYWVFIDGRLKLERKGLRPINGAIEVNIKLEPDDSFLTLAVTDHNGLASYDWVVFGDPVLDVEQIEPED